MSWKPLPVIPDLSVNLKHSIPSTITTFLTINGAAVRLKVRHLTCIRMGMFLIMREEECAESKGGCCMSGGFVLKGNVVVKGKVIPCMLSLIKYVAQRKCALFCFVQTSPPDCKNKQHISRPVRVKSRKSATLSHINLNIFIGHRKV